MFNILKILLCVTFCQFIGASSLAVDSGDGTYRIVRDIVYHQEDTVNCWLDIYIPADVKEFRTLIWFHGGSLKQGNRTRVDATSVGEGFGSKGFAVVMVDYRLYPDARFPDFLIDAAASVDWVLEHIEEYGGGPERVFVGGHSAGGYMCAMLALDPGYLSSFGRNPDDVCGYIPVSGQMDCHSSVKEEWGLDPNEIIVNRAAPLNYITDPAPPILFLYGENDSPGRGEINKRITSLLSKNQNENISIVEIPDCNHGTIIHSDGQMNHVLYKAIVEFIGKSSCLQTGR